MAENRFAKFKVSSDLPEDFGKPAQKEKSEQKAWMFRPGLYKDCVIKSVEEMADPCKADPTWIKVRMTIAQDRREIRKLVLVPTQDITYGPDQSSGPFSMLVKFLAAFGVELTSKNAGTVIPEVFGEINNFVGQRLDITVGHSGHYCHYVDKNSYHLYSKFDKPVCEKGTQNPMTFPSPEACEVYCTEFLKQEYSPWPEVKFVNAPTTASDKPLVMPKKPKEEKKKGTVSW